MTDLRPNRRKILKGAGAVAATAALLSFRLSKMLMLFRVRSARPACQVTRGDAGGRDALRKPRRAMR